MRAVAAAPVAHPEAAARLPVAGTGGHRQRALGGGGGGGGRSSVAAQAARMLPRRLCLVPLLLALGVGSSSGSGDGGDSRRRRLLAAKGWCWGSFFLTRKEPGKAGWRVQIADLRVQYPPFPVAASVSRARSPKSALSCGPKRFSGPFFGRGPGAKEKARSMECRELWGPVCWVGSIAGSAQRCLEQGPGTGAVGGRGRGGGQVSVYSCPGGKNQGHLQRSELRRTGTPGWGWLGNL